MRRRNLLLGAAGTGLGAMTLGLAATARAAAPDGLPPMPRTLVNIMLRGGLDTRYVFMPVPSPSSNPSSDNRASYIDALWAARADLYRARYPSYEAMFDAEYLLAADPRTGERFGIHSSCGWLHEEYQAGRVAIIANTFGATNRRHDQAQLNVDVAEPDLDMMNQDRDGWGGRFVEAIGGGARCVELGTTLSPFNKGYDPNDRLTNVVHARDTRDMAMPRPDSSRAEHSRNVLSRAMRGYYQVRGAEIKGGKPIDWPYRRFFDHFNALEAMGSSLDGRISAMGATPAAFHDDALKQNGWGQQCANLYDLTMLHDLFSARCLSMQRGGYDHHASEEKYMDRQLPPVLGRDGGLALATREIAALGEHGEQALDHMVFNLATDFGRQLIVNGSHGTDHGHGLYSVVIGRAINGGTYGEMFPQAEAAEDEDGRVPLEVVGGSIEGRTSTERVVAALCDWASPGSGLRVAVNAGVAPIETAGMLNDLMRA